MRRLFAPLALLAVVGILWAGVTPPAGACSCFPPPPNVPSNFSGFIVKARVASPQPTPQRDSLIVLQVETYFEGVGPERLIVNTQQSRSCPPNIFPDARREYLLVAYNGTNWLYLIACAGGEIVQGDALSERMMKSVRALYGEGVPPVSEEESPSIVGQTLTFGHPQTPAAGTTTSDPLAWALIIGGGIVLPVAFLLGASFVSRRGAGH